MMYPVITISQPWAALIVSGIKDIENRSWRLPGKYCNCTVLVHTSAKPKFDGNAARLEQYKRDLPFTDFAPQTTFSGVIIGALRFNKCIRAEDMRGQLRPSPWADRTCDRVFCSNGSAFWWMIEKAMPLTPIPAKGRLNFWKFDYPQEITWPEEI